MTVEELMKELSSKNPKAKVMVISPHDEDAYLEVCDCEEEFFTLSNNRNKFSSRILKEKDYGYQISSGIFSGGKCENN